MDDKELAHMVMEAEKPQSCSWKLETPESRGCSFHLSQGPEAKENRCPSLKTGRKGDFSLSQTFVLFRLLTDWMGLIHIKEGSLLDSVSKSDVDFISKHRHTHSQNNG